MGLLRRHIAAVLVVLAAVLVVAHYLKASTQPFQDSGVVIFTAPPSSAFPNPYSAPNGSLIVVAGIIATRAMDSHGQEEVQAAGGAGQYSVSLVNSYNLEYPAYDSPALTVTADSVSPSVASRTFTAVTQVLTQELSNLQDHANLPQTNRISAEIVGATGPLSQQGSSKRVYAGVLFLAIIAIFAVAGFLDRHPFRLPRVWQFRSAKQRGAADRATLAGERSAG
jgi:hypothetical protein